MTSKSIEEKLKKNLAFLEYYRLLFKNYPRKKYFVPLAETYRSLEYYDEAIEVLKEGLTTHPEYIIARALLAQTYFQMGYFVQSSQEAHKAIDADPQNVLALKIYIRSCIKLDQREKAKYAIVQLEALLPEDEEAKEWKEGIENPPLISLQAPIGKIEDFSLKRLTPKNDKKEVIDTLNRLLIKIDQKRGGLCQQS